MTKCVKKNKLSCKLFSSSSTFYIGIQSEDGISFNYSSTFWLCRYCLWFDKQEIHWPPPKMTKQGGRIMFKINPYNHVSNNDIHVKWGWKSFHSRRKLHSNIMVSKSQNTLAPPYLEESFKYCIYPYSLRSQWHIKLPKPKSECCRKMFVYKGSREYNDLPLTIKLSNSLKTFCKNLNLRNQFCFDL